MVSQPLVEATRDATSLLLRTEGLAKHYAVHRGLTDVFRGRQAGHVRALDGVDISVERGSTVAVVGESGSGKTTLARLILMLETPTAGLVEFEGSNLASLSPRGLRQIRQRMQAVFQDPASSLNPRQRVWDIVSHPLKTHGRVTSRADRIRQASELLELVELRSEDGRRLPHQFSLGQRQRIAIARAVALRPALIVADEPVSALDVSVQAQILNLLARLQKELGLSYVFISHDLRVVRHLSHWVYVMYGGRVVEEGPVDQIFEEPHHPYTQALLAAVPRVGTSPVVPVQGEPLNPRHVPVGCRFQSRCPYVRPECCESEPALDSVGATHASRCLVPLHQRQQSVPQEQVAE